VNTTVDDLHTDVIDEISNQCLTFFLNGEEYGIEILKVMEIRKWETPTAMPGSNNNVLGMINIRGNVVPIIDLRSCFDMPKKESDKVTVIIIIQIKDGDSSQIIGIVADRVSDVYNFKSSQMKSVPDTVMVDRRYVKNIAVVDNKMVILLCVNSIFEGKANPEDSNQTLE
jgi:purine-binding chemotaxis protein CheW